MRRQTGLTLLQLIVVIAIIGILAAILVPVIARARSSALTVSCASNLSQIGKALHMYARDWDGCAPPFTTAAVRGPEHDDNFDDLTDEEKVEKILRERKPTTAELRRAYEPYIKNDQIWHCPAEPFARKEGEYRGQSYDYCLTTYHTTRTARWRPPVPVDLPYDSHGRGLPPGWVEYAWDRLPVAHSPGQHRHGRLEMCVFFDGHVASYQSRYRHDLAERRQADRGLGKGRH